MNRQKLEHLIETLDFVRRWQVGQTDAVDREIAKVQENYRTMVGHYYHFRENAFYEHNSPIFPISKTSGFQQNPERAQEPNEKVLDIASDYQRRNVDSPQRVSPSSSFPNEADTKKAEDVLIPEEFHFKCKYCHLEIPSPKEEPMLFDMNQETGEGE